MELACVDKPADPMSIPEFESIYCGERIDAASELAAYSVAQVYHHLDPNYDMNRCPQPASYANLNITFYWGGLLPNAQLHPRCTWRFKEKLFEVEADVGDEDCVAAEVPMEPIVQDTDLDTYEKMNVLWDAVHRIAYNKPKPHVPEERRPRIAKRTKQ